MYVTTGFAMIILQMVTRIIPFMLCAYLTVKNVYLLLILLQESCLLLGQMTKTFDAMSLIDVADANEIGETFVKILTHCRHRVSASCDTNIRQLNTSFYKMCFHKWFLKPFTLCNVSTVCCHVYDNFRFGFALKLMWWLICAGFVLLLTPATIRNEFL